MQQLIYSSPSLQKGGQSESVCGLSWSVDQWYREYQDVRSPSLCLDSRSVSQHTTNLAKTDWNIADRRPRLRERNPVLAATGGVRVCPPQHRGPPEVWGPGRDWEVDQTVRDHHLGTISPGCNPITHWLVWQHWDISLRTRWWTWWRRRWGNTPRLQVFCWMDSQQIYPRQVCARRRLERQSKWSCWRFLTSLWLTGCVSLTFLALTWWIIDQVKRWRELQWHRGNHSEEDKNLQWGNQTSYRRIFQACQHGKMTVSAGKFVIISTLSIIFSKVKADRKAEEIFADVRKLLEFWIYRSNRWPNRLTHLLQYGENIYFQILIVVSCSFYI